MLRTFKARRALVFASLLAAGGAFVLPGTASAQSDSHSVSCSGLHVAVDSQVDGPQDNFLRVTVNGVTDVVPFDRTVEVFYPFDETTTTEWSYTIDNENDHWDKTVSGTQEPCVDPTTTTEETTTTEPTTTDPGTTEPGTTEPGTTEPGTTEPGTTEPGTTDPGTTDPGTTDPGTTDPGTTDPGTTEPATTDPGTTGPATSAPNSSVSGSTPNSPTPNNPAPTLAPLLGQLPDTGSASTPIALIGAAFVVVGASTLLAARRRAAH